MTPPQPPKITPSSLQDLLSPASSDISMFSASRESYECMPQRAMSDAAASERCSVVGLRPAPTLPPVLQGELKTRSSVHHAGSLVTSFLVQSADGAVDNTRVVITNHLFSESGGKRGGGGNYHTLADRLNRKRTLKGCVPHSLSQIRTAKLSGILLCKSQRQ